MKKILVQAVLFAVLFSPFAIAHDGHDHDAQTKLRAPKGGIIKVLDEARVEVVSKGTILKIYVYDKTGKPEEASRFGIVAKVKLPRVKKIEEIKLVPKGKLFESTYDAKGSHRYTLMLAVKDSKTTRTDELTFVIEPRK